MLLITLHGRKIIYRWYQLLPKMSYLFCGLKLFPISSMSIINFGALCCHHVIGSFIHDEFCISAKNNHQSCSMYR